MSAESKNINTSPSPGAEVDQGITTKNPQTEKPCPTHQHFAVSAELEAEVEELLTHYPQKRSAALMVLHAIQERFGYISPQAMEWTAQKLGVEPICIYELVTFYPMFHRKPVGTFHIRICRTLSCALAGSYQLREFFCKKLGLDPHLHGAQTTPDGLFTVEFVECLASCDKAPVIMRNDELIGNVTLETAQKIIDECKAYKKENPLK